MNEMNNRTHKQIYKMPKALCTREITMKQKTDRPNSQYRFLTSVLYLYLHLCRIIMFNSRRPSIYKTFAATAIHKLFPFQPFSYILLPPYPYPPAPTSLRIPPSSTPASPSNVTFKARLKAVPLAPVLISSRTVGTR